MEVEVESGAVVVRPARPAASRAMRKAELQPYETDQHRAQRPHRVHEMVPAEPVSAHHGEGEFY